MFETINPVSLIITIASMAILPLIAVTATSFLKISAVLMILRNAIGVQQVPSNMVVYGVAMVMSLIVMGPIFKDMGARFAPEGKVPESGTEIVSAIDRALPPLKVFLLEHVDDEYHDKFYKKAVVFQEKYNSVKLEKEDLFVLLPAFVASELSDAFVLGVLIYLPFVIIDLAVSSVLMALGMMMVSPMSITVPLKILLFVAVDGWSRTFEGLLASYASQPMLMFYVKQALWITLLVGGPLVIFTMIVGLTLGFLQAVLQLQDQAFPFGVKLIGSILILMIAGPWLASTMMEFTIGVFSMFDQI